jgi:hypothetical protein
VNLPLLADAFAVIYSSLYPQISRICLPGAPRRITLLSAMRLRGETSFIKLKPPGTLKSCNGCIRLSGSARSAFPGVMTFLWASSPSAASKGLFLWANLPCTAASFLCPIWVVRISRLIGTSDTTGTGVGLQVPANATEVVAKRGPLQCFCKMVQTHKTPLTEEWRFASLRWSLASQQIMGSG